MKRELNWSSIQTVQTFSCFFLFNWEKKRTTLWFYLATLIPVVYVRFCSKVDYINNKTIYKFIVHTLFQTRDFNLHELLLCMHALIPIFISLILNEIKSSNNFQVSLSSEFRIDLILYGGKSKYLSSYIKQSLRI